MEVILWTCQYVTETLIWCRDSCLHSPELNITLFNLAVTFSNALEESGVHMILELEWDQLILEFLQGFQHLQVQTKASEVRNVNALSGSKSVETSTNTQKDILLIPELEETLLVREPVIYSNWSPFYSLFCTSRYSFSSYCETMERN